MMEYSQLPRALQAYILGNDALGEAEIAAAIASSPAISAATRLNIYADAYRVRLIEALQANFPVLAQALGEAAFALLAQQYLAVVPSRHYSVRFFGHRLAEFLRTYDPYHEQPWLLELATWEWSVATAFDAADTPLLTIETLTEVPANAWPELRFVLHPSVHTITLTHNVAALVNAVAHSEALPAPQALAMATEWLIWRENLQVHYRSLAAPEAVALTAIREGATFSEMCESIANHAANTADDAEIPMLAAGLLKRWITAQVLAAPA
jgi:hypothetical protein